MVEFIFLSRESQLNNKACTPFTILNSVILCEEDIFTIKFQKCKNVKQVITLEPTTMFLVDTKIITHLTASPNHLSLFFIAQTARPLFEKCWLFI